MTLAVNRVMAKGSLYDPDLAALARSNNRAGSDRGDLSLIRAYRPRYQPSFWAASNPVDTACDGV